MNTLNNALNIASKFVVKSYSTLILLTMPSLILLLITIFLDFSTAKDAAWLQNNTLGLIFFSFLYFTRVFAFVFALISLSWMAGAGLFGETISFSEIFSKALRGTLRSVFIILPLWFLTVFFSTLAFLCFSLVYFTFAPVSTIFVYMIYLALALFLFPILVMLIAKFINIIPILTFEGKPGILALSLAIKHLKYASFLKSGLKPFAIYSLFVVSVILPSWSFSLPIWQLFSASQILIFQSCAIIFSAVLMPISVVYITAIYFAGDFEA